MCEAVASTAALAAAPPAPPLRRRRGRAGPFAAAYEGRTVQFVHDGDLVRVYVYDEDESPG
ncbi:hypothetical protein [Microbacterium aquimaris]|uniref:Uncharacterized protein n=1 Tax=Microbacterium aquimaris TaxID=459816 RepID=A0ABU5N325_9MICO|nr:hypothetical protein [Microbacterium aquimaris]MDZ8160490.1 hypothetical protein [Microbacterium aquimaris]